MKRFLMIAAAAVGATLISAAPADARDGCGPGGHRGPGGFCRPNHGPRYGYGYGYGYGVRRGPPVIGVYYGGRGYWDGRGYRPHRYRYRDGWRYR